MAAPATSRLNLTDRAKRYRAQNAVTGPRKCVLCGSTSDLGVMHLDGNESHGEPANLAWGCRSCNQKLAAAFKAIGAGRLTNQYNPSQGVPTFEQYMWAVSNHTRGAKDEAGAVIHATPKHKRIEYASRIWALRRERGTDSSLPDWARNPAAEYAVIETPRGGKAKEITRYADRGQAEKHARELQLHFSTTGTRWTVKKVKANPAKFDRCVKEVKAKGGKGKNAYAICTAAGTRGKGRKNPAAASAEVFEDFHGYPPSEVVTVTKQVHRHAHLASLGLLISLDVWGVDGRGHKIEGFDGALLCSNEDRNQLFIEGGDQSVNLRDFGIKSEHELETLGTVVEIAYQTNKTHLGDEGGHAVYVHKFRTTNDGGKHVTVRMTREPDLVYDVRNQQLLFSGGSYTILREGIDK